MSVGAVFYQTALLSSMILLGYILSKTGYFTAGHSSFISRLLLDLCIPAMILSAGSTDLGEGGLASAAAVVALFLAVMFFFTFFCGMLGRLLRLDPDEALVFSRSASYPNNGFMGLPLATALFGTQGTVWCAFTMLAGNIYLFSMVLQSFSRREGEKGDLRSHLLSLITPLNISSVVMLVMMFTGWKLPAFAKAFCDSMGGCTTPLAMMVVGSLLASSPLLETLKRPSLYLITLFRNIITPLTLAFLLKALGWNREMDLCLVLMMGCSIASTVSIVANRYQRAPAFASQALLQTNLLLPLSLPLVMSLAQQIL
mgnify:FL=1